VNHSGGWLISLIFDGQTARVFLWARSSVEMLTCSGLQSKTACSQSMGFFGSH